MDQTRLHKRLEEIRKNNRDKEEEKDFEEWSDHYHEDLIYMYNEHVDLNITFEMFVHIAYQCSDLRDRKMFKYTRLLI